MLSNEPSFAFITVCKGRLDHLKQTLPLMLDQLPDEIVVVDYDCPQGTAKWVANNYPSVKLVTLDGASKNFCLADGRNRGYQAATAQILCFIDADILVANDFVRHIKQEFHPACFYRQAFNANEKLPDTWGTVVVSRDSCNELEGYDALYRGYGGEDDDFYWRLTNAGHKQQYFPDRFLNAIPHSDDLRLTFYGKKNKLLHTTFNRLYSIAKRNAMSFFRYRNELPQKIRIEISQRVQKYLDERSKGGGKSTPPLQFKFNAFENYTDKKKIVKNCSFSIDFEDI